MVYSVIFGANIHLEISGDGLSLHLFEHNPIMQIGIIDMQDDSILRITSPIYVQCDQTCL